MSRHASDRPECRSMFQAASINSHDHFNSCTFMSAELPFAMSASTLSSRLSIPG